MTNTNTTNINPVTILIDKNSSKINPNHLTNTMKFLLVFSLLIIIGFIGIISIYMIKVNELKKNLKLKDKIIIDTNKSKNFSEENQQLINQVKRLKHVTCKLSIKYTTTKDFFLSFHSNSSVF